MTAGSDEAFSNRSVFQISRKAFARPGAFPQLGEIAALAEENSDLLAR